MWRNNFVNFLCHCSTIRTFCMNRNIRNYCDLSSGFSSGPAEISHKAYKSNVFNKDDSGVSFGEDLARGGFLECGRQFRHFDANEGAFARAALQIQLKIRSVQHVQPFAHVA